MRQCNKEAIIKLETSLFAAIFMLSIVSPFCALTKISFRIAQDLSTSTILASLVSKSHSSIFCCSAIDLIVDGSCHEKGVESGLEKDFSNIKNWHKFPKCISTWNAKCIS